MEKNAAEMSIKISCEHCYVTKKQYIEQWKKTLRRYRLIEKTMEYIGARMGIEPENLSAG